MEGILLLMDKASVQILMGAKDMTMMALAIITMLTKLKHQVVGQNGELVQLIAGKEMFQRLPTSGKEMESK